MAKEKKGEGERENKLTGCALSVGCTLLRASMSHSKGGSENVCVKNDTGAGLALGSVLPRMLRF